MDLSRGYKLIFQRKVQEIQSRLKKVIKLTPLDQQLYIFDFRWTGNRIHKFNMAD